MLSDMHCWLYQCPEADTEATALKKKKKSSHSKIRATQKY